MSNGKTYTKLHRVLLIITCPFYFHGTKRRYTGILHPHLSQVAAVNVPVSKMAEGTMLIISLTQARLKEGRKEGELHLDEGSLSSMSFFFNSQSLLDRQPCSLTTRQLQLGL